MIRRDSELRASSTHQADLIILNLSDECPTHKTQSRSKSCVSPSSHSMLRLYTSLLSVCTKYQCRPRLYHTKFKKNIKLMLRLTFEERLTLKTEKIRIKGSK